MLHWRLLLGTVFIAGLIGLCWLDSLSHPPGVILLPLAVVLCVLASQEYLGLLAARGENARQPIASAVYAGSVAVVVANAIPVIWTTLAAANVQRMDPL